MSRHELGTNKKTVEERMEDYGLKTPIMASLREQK